ncbi:MAG: DUF5658 family protein [Planctomycetota bacterium]
MESQEQPHPAKPIRSARSAKLRRKDRREGKTPRFSTYSLAGGQRTVVRRAAEREGSFVDLYGAGLLIALMWIILANVADSFFTLIHLQGGGTEINPIADYLLQAGLTRFVILKSALVGMALLVLCVHKNFKIARIGLWTAAGAYTLLVAYHLALFA